MIHNLEYIKGYYRWREETLKPMTKHNWKAKSHIRYLNVCKGATLKMLTKLRRTSEFFGRYN